MAGVVFLAFLGTIASGMVSCCFLAVSLTAMSKMLLLLCPVNNGVVGENWRELALRNGTSLSNLAFTVSNFYVLTQKSYNKLNYLHDTKIRTKIFVKRIKSSTN